MAVIEVAPGAADATIIELAVRERRIFITEDRDFGQLVYAASKPTCGVILLRFPSNARAALPGMIIEFLSKHGQKLGDRFVVLQPGRTRLGGNPRG
jgi:predicted nuclease of predicted toxin-antitoxin system